MQLGSYGPPLRAFLLGLSITAGLSQVVSIGTVEGKSMWPLLNDGPTRDWIFLKRFGNHYNRGDVVVAKYVPLFLIVMTNE